MTPRLAVILIFSGSGIFAPVSRAQTLKASEQAKVNGLKVRLDKAYKGKSQAQAILDQYRVFQVAGDVNAGDNKYASLWGSANYSSGPIGGAGGLTDKHLIYVKNPVDSGYRGSMYLGFCTFLGVVDGRNTYLPVERIPNYMMALSQVQKWDGIQTSINAEIDTIYLPYQRKARNQAAAQAAQQARQAQVKADKEQAKAASERENQQRVNQAREQLAKEKEALEKAKDERAAKETADAEIARIAAELEKTKAEKARLDAETQKQEQEAAHQKAKELEDIEAKKQAAIEDLKNTPSIIAGAQLGKIRLGMTNAQVLQLLGTPDASEQLKKVVPFQDDPNVAYYSNFIPRQIRRDRYYIEATDGLDIFYDGSPTELKFYSQERGIETVHSGDLKTKYVFDVFYVDGKVVQLESDSPQFFSAKKENLQTEFEWEKAYRSGFIMSYQGLPKTSWGGNTGTLRIGSFYTGSQETGISLCMEAVLVIPGEQTKISPSARSRMKVLIHYPNTVPYTGNYQLGISLTNNSGGRSDAENKEERMYAAPLNSTPTIPQAVGKAASEKVEDKIKRNIGKFLPRR